MKQRIVALSLAILLALSSNFAFGRGHGGHRGGGHSHPYYGGGHHTYSHGGHYAGGHGSSHKGGHYRNSRTNNTYGRHK